MAVKVVKKGTVRIVSGKGRAGDARPSAAPRSSPPPQPSSPVKWVVLGVLVFAVVVAMLVAAAVSASKGGSKRGGVRFVYGDGSSGRRYGRDATTESMGGKSMKEWCAEHEKDNEMVQQRRARRRGR